MRVNYVCPACGVTVSAPPSLAGASAPCPACKAPVASWPAPLPSPGILVPVPVPAGISRRTTDRADLLFLVAMVAILAVGGAVAYHLATREPSEEQKKGLERLGLVRHGVGDEVGRSWGLLGPGRQFVIVAATLSLAAAPFVPYFAAGSREPFRSSVHHACAGYTLVGLLGLVLSQFSPMFGGIVAEIVPPFSVVRIALVPAHVFVFGLIGLTVGGATGAIRGYSDTHA